MSQNLDLTSIFQAVTQTLADNQQALNQADTQNQDHGTNMVRTFQTITQALQQQQGKPDGAALGYAAHQLSDTASSGSAKLYAEGLSQAANAFQGKDIDAGSAMQLLQYMIGGGQAQPQPAGSGGGDMLGSLLGGMLGGGQNQTQPSTGNTGDLLGSLLGGMLGGNQPAQPQPQQTTGGAGDLLGSLLGGVLGGGQTQPTQSSQNNGLDMGDLMNAGMAYMQTKSRGGSNVEAIVQAFMAASGMGTSAHRTQSTQLVVGTFLKALSAFGGAK